MVGQKNPNLRVNDLSKSYSGPKPRPGGINPPKEYKFKRKKRKDIVNAMEIVVFSLTDAEIDPALRKEIEDLVSQAIRDNKDSKQLAYTIVKE